MRKFFYFTGFEFRIILWWMLFSRLEDSLRGFNPELNAFRVGFGFCPISVMINSNFSNFLHPNFYFLFFKDSTNLLEGDTQVIVSKMIGGGYLLSQNLVFINYGYTLRPSSKLNENEKTFRVYCFNFINKLISGIKYCQYTNSGHRSLLSLIFTNQPGDWRSSWGYFR